MQKIVDKPSARMQFLVFIVAMVMMSVIGIFSSDIYLPSMPNMATYFGVDYSVIQKTITVYLIGLAAFQLLYGPISDHFGRKKTLMVGLGIYIVASVGCVFSLSIEQLLIFRFLQGVGACAALVMGRTIVTDIFNKVEAPHIFSIVLPFVAMSPAIAPVIGGHVQDLLGWRYVMAFTVLFGVVLMGVVFFYMGETLSNIKFKPFEPMSLVLKNMHLLRVSRFVSYCLVIGCVYSNWFAYLSDSAYIYKSFGLTASLIGYCYISQSLSSVAGSFTLKRLLRTMRIDTIIGLALLGNLFVCGLLIVLGYINIWWFLGLVTFMAFTNGMLLPANISSAMSAAVHEDVSLGGTASGLVGFIQIGGAVIGTWLVSEVPQHAASLGVVLTGFMVFAILIYSWRFSENFKSRTGA